MLPRSALLNQTTYNLNKSKSNSNSVGLYYPFQLAAVVKTFGNCKQYVVFNEEKSKLFVEQRDDINMYFHTLHMRWKPIQIGSKSLTFEIIYEKKVLKIEDSKGNGVYLAWESIAEKAGLEQFVDRIKEHIKYYSDSDASSDDGCAEDDNKLANTVKEKEEKKKQ
ncbi:hypothetical protein FQA39_LY12415 [Lamprigera yunnana]|nr:hypothetical protein FQA39_LY12415 [Lamprigera yunnana]